MRVPSSCSVALAAGLALGSSALVAACTNAPDTEEGGDLRFDASPPASALCAAVEDAGSSAWSDSYADYFGPSGVASCAGTVGQCHGESSGLGAQASGYVCAGGVAGCYQGITSPTAKLIALGSDHDPTTTTLYLTLRKACGGGTMPLQPASFDFSATDVTRIAGWIGAGAPDN